LPKVDVVAFQEADGRAPLLSWIDDLVPLARAKCLVRLARLAELGHELRRPEADHLGEGLYELGVKHQRVNLRMLYFFHGECAVVVSHGFRKQRSSVPQSELALARWRRRLFEASPEAHTYQGEVD